MNKLAVVVLNWNGSKIIKPCLESLIKQTFSNLQIIVVDNDSKDDSPKLLKELEALHSERLHVIYNSKNSGFAGGVNIGIKYAVSNGFDGIALFNSDATADKDWLKNLAKVLDNRKDVGIATGLILHKNGQTIDSTGEFYSKWGLAFPRDRNKSKKKSSSSGYVFSCSGGASLYRTDMLKEIGYFDESFFAYYEDVDVGFRAQLAGWKAYYTDKATVFHEQGGTSKKLPGFTVKQTFRNLPLLFLKNVPNNLFIPIGSRLFLSYFLIFIKACVDGNIIPAFRGWFESIFFTPKALLKRVSIQNNKKVDNEYLKSVLYNDLPPEQSGIRKFRYILSLGKIK